MRTQIAVLLGVLLVLSACTTGTDESALPSEPAQQETQDAASNDAVVIALTGHNFAFEGSDGTENPTLRVSEGDLVRIEFASTDGFHDWVVDELDAATARVRPEDGVTVVEFTADVAGEYEYYCSVGQHRANGMYGTLIVE